MKPDPEKPACPPPLDGSLPHLPRPEKEGGQPATLPTRFLEREVKFFMPIDELRQWLQFDQLETLELRQRYFPASLLSNAEAIVRTRYGLELPEKISPVQARLRETIGVSGTSYCLELKGAKYGPPGKAIERMEIPLPLTKEAFEVLSAFATDGTIIKTRYQVPGTIEDRHGLQIPVIAQIDVIALAHKAENSKDRYVGSFATVDIELPDKSLLKRLRNGHHSFEFLRHGAVDLALQDDEVVHAVSNNRLGRKGFDDKARHAIDRLKRQYQKGKS